MSTRIEILSEEAEHTVGGVVLATSSTSFHTFTLTQSHDEVVAELLNMGAEAVDGPKAAIVFIEHWEGEITVVVEDAIVAEEVRHRLTTA